MPHDMAGNDGNPDRGTAPFDGESHPFRVSGARFSRANGLERALPLLRQACGQPVNPVFLQFDDFVFGFDHATGHFQQVGRTISPSPRISHSRETSGYVAINFAKVSSVIPVGLSKVPRDIPVLL